ncbi:MAG: lipoyl synthase [Salinivirgaceae bacterium]|nr:lipoyl synthase [Salinivirgaceae bacterium]MDD4746216.1 lipoyl synthase [Salinivirgaceae bacterium]MDY0279377.1 lipoyl synthase [Salinivirgaceae bacterium]
MKISRKPEWLKIQLPKTNEYQALNDLIVKGNLHTICTSGKCPNMGECWSAGTASFMILGDICTRACKFCNVTTGKPLPPDTNEPVKLAKAIHTLGLKHVVITSVDRDDLADGGANHWAATITAIKRENPTITIETLIPDFDGNTNLLDIIITSKPDIVSHNLETVERLTPEIRTKAKYRTSLSVLEYLAKNGVTTKSGVMLGIGEQMEEVYTTMDDLLAINCKIMTIGQYLQPTTTNLPVERFVTPEEFKNLEIIGLKKGFAFVESGPLVRSSYHAEKHV